MTAIDFVSVSSVVLGIFTSGTLILVTAAIANEKNREAVLNVLAEPSPSKHGLERIAKMWAALVGAIFGERVFAKRQLLSIPIYTLCVSMAFFCTWIVYVYIFQNPEHLLAAPLPLPIKQALHDYFHRGFLASIALDTVTIQLCKACIKVGHHHGFASFRFYCASIATAAFSILIFTLVVLGFRLDDMITVYLSVAPNEMMPIIPYQPIKFLLSALHPFSPETPIYVTSKGLYSSYFMPEPLIFYCGAVGQFSLMCLAFAYHIGLFVDWSRKKAIRFVEITNDPRAQAKATMFLIWIVLISMLLVMLALWILIAQFL